MGQRELKIWERFGSLEAVKTSPTHMPIAKEIT
jgi:hypothetical protein